MEGILKDVLHRLYDIQVFTLLNGICTGLCLIMLVIIYNKIDEK